MSCDIRLLDPATKEVLELEAPHQMRSGTYALGGTREMWLNITYNYSDWYSRGGVFPDGGDGRGGIRSIYGLTGIQSIPILKNAIAVLEAMTEDISREDLEDCKMQGVTGYWLPTRANAIKPLYSLLAFAQARPDGVWDGD